MYMKPMALSCSLTIKPIAQFTLEPVIQCNLRPRSQATVASVSQMGNPSTPLKQDLPFEMTQ